MRRWPSVGQGATNPPDTLILNLQPQNCEKIIFLIYFWLHWVFIAVRQLSLVVVSRDCSSLRCLGFSLQWLLLLQSVDARVQASGVVVCGLSSCGAWVWLP